MTDAEIIDRFHQLYYAPAHSSTYLGRPLWKSPTDMFLYQEVIVDARPSVIIECGTAFGASALFMANYLGNAGIDGGVLSVDIAEGTEFQGLTLPAHERITYLRGKSSVDPEVLAVVADQVADLERRMVILDSDHSMRHVLAELEAYAPLVTRGSWLVVEDVNVNGHPVFPTHGPGPQEALDEWLPAHPEFRQMHLERGRYLFSFHAWLRRE